MKITNTFSKIFIGNQFNIGDLRAKLLVRNFVVKYLLESIKANIS